jgi:hypothetical protein
MHPPHNPWVVGSIPTGPTKWPTNKAYQQEDARNMGNRNTPSNLLRLRNDDERETSIWLRTHALRIDLTDSPVLGASKEMVAIVHLFRNGRGGNGSHECRAVVRFGAADGRNHLRNAHDLRDDSIDEDSNSGKR